MTAVTLFGFAQSTYVRTVRLVCVEKGVGYELVALDFGAESHRATHPYLKMPALRHGDLWLFETLAVASYLNAAFDGPGLEPASAAGRARMLQWISAANAYLYEATVGAAKSGAVDDTALDHASALLLPVEAALAGSPFLAGDDLSLADLFLLPMLLYADQAIGGSRLCSRLPAVAGWMHRLRDRPSVLNTRAEE